MFNIDSLLLQIKNRRPVVIIAPLVFGFFTGGVLVVKPALNNLRSIRSDIASLTEKVSSYTYVLEGESKLLNYKKLFSGDRTWLIEQINSIAEKSGLSILSILPEEPGKATDLLERSSVRIEAEATYHQLGAFVSQLESLDSYVKLQIVEISTERDGAGQQSAPWQGTSPDASRKKNPNICRISLSVGLFTPNAGAL